ncbi:MAG: asparagine synthase-related protein, partial [Ardenticatenaceae bacterium]
EQAVAASLRATGPLAISLSGGLDSSSIAVVAHRLMHEEQRIPDVPTYLYTHRARGWQESDESVYRDAVVARLPHFRGVCLDREWAWDWPLVERWQRHLSMPAYLPNGYSFQPRIDRAQADGCRVLISGAGGDIITGGEDYALIPVFDSLPLLQRVSELPYFAHGGPRAYGRLFKEWLRFHLPAAILAWWQRRRRAPRLATEKCEALAACRLANARGAFNVQRSTFQQHFERVLTSFFFLIPFELNPELLALHGIEYRCPFYDRRLVELAFHLPLSLRISRGRNRLQIKRALADDLPPELLSRTTKAHFTRFTGLAVAEEDHTRAVDLLGDGFLARQGWIAEEIWPRWAAQTDNPMQRIYLHRAAHIEQWLSSLTEQMDSDQEVSERLKFRRSQ